MKILEIIKIIFGIIAIILSIITIIMIITKLLGYSPDELTITMWIAGVIISLEILVITILFQIKGDVSNLMEFKRQSIEFQNQTVSKIKEIENKL